MSSSADRGNTADVRKGARLGNEAAASWLDRREQTLAENEQRRGRRETCLRDSALAGAAAGTMGAVAMYRFTMRRSAYFRNFLGGGGQAFQVVFGFFMPFMFISNVVRWRCQKAGLHVPTAMDMAPPQKWDESE